MVAVGIEGRPVRRNVTDRDGRCSDEPVMIGSEAVVVKFRDGNQNYRVVVDCAPIEVEDVSTHQVMPEYPTTRGIASLLKCESEGYLRDSEEESLAGQPILLLSLH
jgi:hypothetical protein